jgi:fructose-bisphosphate aldolase class I
VRTCNVHEVAADEMILDVGPLRSRPGDVLKTCRRWSGTGRWARSRSPIRQGDRGAGATAAALTKAGRLARRSQAAAIRSPRSTMPGVADDFSLHFDGRRRLPRMDGRQGTAGCILFERTMDGEVDGKPTPQALIARGVVPFIKIDKGLEDEVNGVQLMKPMPELDALLTRAKALGVYGTKERSVINSANREGIAAVVKQQFEVGAQVLAHGMMPMIEPEVNIKSETRAECDQILLEEILKNLEALPEGQQVMLKLSLPTKPGLFDPLVDHPKVLRVVALSGGYKRPEACVELSKNRGIIASFSRALLEDLRHQMSDDDFNASLGGAIDEIHAASTAKALSPA